MGACISRKYVSIKEHPDMPYKQFYKLIDNNDVKTIRETFNAYPSIVKYYINNQGSYGNTPLSRLLNDSLYLEGTTVSCLLERLNDNVEKIKLLLEYKADIHGKTSEGITPLRTSVELGFYPEVVQLLIDKKIICVEST